MVTKAHILQEIKRTAEENGGRPLGSKSFQTETGIRQCDWYRKYWIRWNDAILEANLAPNQLTGAIPDEELLEKYAQLARELGRIPVSGDIRLKARNDPDFPSERPFRRIGSKVQIVKRLLYYCKNRRGYQDILRMCEDYVPREQDAADKSARQKKTGYVYIYKSAGLYYIGQSESMERRAYEHEIKQAGKVAQFSKIPTPYPRAVEKYWHTRFADKKRHGSFYALDSEDVKAIKRCELI